MALRLESAAAAWTSSSTRASSSSRATACPSRRARPPPPSSRRWPPPTSSATRASIKAQVLIGGRGKAGGIKVANDRTEAEEHARAILGMDIRGFTVHELWVEQASDIAAEYYASIVFDRSAKKPLVMLSTQGGMDIEEVAELRSRRDRAAARRPAARVPGLPRAPARLRGRRRRRRDPRRRRAAGRLYDAFVAEEALLVEVNPLIVTGDRTVTALDAKVTLDDNALFRHPDNAELRDVSRRGPAGADGARARADLRQARRRRRDPRQRRGARDEHARRRGPGGRQAGQLPRRRRRRQGRGDHQRRRGDPLEREGHGRAVQHLRRHHPLRRGRQGPDRGVRPDQADGAVRRPARRHQRQGGPGAARRGRPAQRAHGGHHAGAPPRGSWSSRGRRHERLRRQRTRSSAPRASPAARAPSTRSTTSATARTSSAA